MSNLRRRTKQSNLGTAKSDTLTTRKRVKPATKNGKVQEETQTQAKRGRIKKPRIGVAEAEPAPQEVKAPEAEVVAGIVMTVGTGDIGQLGLGEDVETRTRPTTVTLQTSVKAICAGGMHTVVLTTNGEIITFGCNDEGAIGRDSSQTGSEYLPDKVELPVKVKQISAGDSHTAVLTDDGHVYIWGNFRDSDGQMGLLKADQKELRPLPVSMTDEVIQIASGSDHLVMLTKKGHIFTCGNAQQGQLGRVPECFSSKGGRKGLDHLLVPSIVRVPKKSGREVLFDAVWAGSCATFARAKISKDIYSCGLNNYCQLGLDGQHNLFNLQVVQSFSNKSWKQFACGDHHSLALTEEGEVYALGRNNYGRLGLGPEAEDAKVPKLISTFKNEPCLSVSCGVSSSFAVSKSGAAYAWGLGNSGQLGQGNEDDLWEPKQMSGKQLANRKVIAVSGGGQHAVLLVVETGEPNSV